VDSELIMTVPFDIFFRRTNEYITGYLLTSYQLPRVHKINCIAYYRCVGVVIKRCSPSNRQSIKIHEYNLLLYISRIRLRSLFPSVINSETMNHFRHFGMTSWTGDQPVARPLTIQDITTQTMRTFIHV
jgi:hypothetical protein